MNLLERHKDKADQFNRYINVGKNIGFCISGTFSGLSKLLENEDIILFISKRFSSFSEIVPYITDYKNIAYIVFGILILVTLLKLFYNAISCRANSIRSMLDLLTMIHKDLVHDIRSRIVETDIYLKNRIKKAKDNNEDIEQVYIAELEKFKENIQPYVDTLGIYLTKYRNKKISVCVKTFINGKMNKSEYMNEELITIARSSNTKNSRNSTRCSVVKNNTDFIDLCCGQSTFFGKANLKKLSDDGLYKNDSPRWWKQYNSTLVAPIRYYNKDRSARNVNIDIDVIGFLCIDCKDDIYEWENGDSFELQLLAVVADSLYTYIRAFYNCFESIGYFDAVREDE